MDRRKPVMNSGEVVAEKAITEAAERCGANVRAKLKLSDVLEVGNSGLTNPEFGYATRAHLDFVVLNANHVAQFAVELDGPQHQTDPRTIARDRMKDDICERLGLLLLRIDSDYLRTEGRFTLIGWLTELWFMQEAFYEQTGHLGPEAEPFIYFSVFEPDEEGRLRPAFALDTEAVGIVVRASIHGLVHQTYPELVVSPYGQAGGFSEAYAVISVADGGHVIGHARLRNFKPFGIGPWELVQDLAVADAGRKLRDVLAGRMSATTDSQLRALRERTIGWSRQGQMAADLPYTAEA